MKVGISTATFFLKELTEDSFSVIQRCGGETAEVFLTTYSEYEPNFIDLLNERRNGLEIYSVHSLNTQFEPQLFNGAARTRKDAETLFRKVLAAGQKLGAKVYTFHAIARLKKNAHPDPVSFGKRLEQLAEISADYGLILCLENVHWASFNTPEFFSLIRDYAPSAGAVLDIKQARQSGYDWREYLDVMGDALKNVHVSDVDEKGDITMVGKGVFPFDELAKRLDGMSYRGPLLIEQYAKNYDSYEEVARSVKYLKNIIGGLKCNLNSTSTI